MAILAWDYRIELVDPEASHRNTSSSSGLQNAQNYNPRPIDLSILTLNREMSSLAEKVAENSHGIWAKKVFDDLASKGKIK